MRKGKTVLLSLVLALFILSFSIAVPILVRPFYYAHITGLKLPEQTGLTFEEIRTAYDEMMDFCLGLRKDFSTGILVWSESGKAHFEDCRSLFLLDLSVLAVTAVILAFLVLWRLRARTDRAPAGLIAGRSFLFWGPVGLLAVGIVTAGLAALDFDRAFVVFHHLFFPGKTNWTFDPLQDSIICVLPQVFFRNAAICILAVLVILCAVCIALDARERRLKREEKN
ncbi:MAG: TIGR01906 family membrane protein [Lachnospiraceae bacterium]|nr:TIGR01906 family membrane protein [Lachnospiraceae bacterium]